MNVMMDIVVATILGAIITVITLNANLVIREAWAGYNSEVVVQQMLITDAQIVESEFRNMGCGVINSSQTITEALDSSITFLMALRPEPNSPIHTVQYYSGSKNELTWTDNPDDRFLYRRLDGGNAETVGIITRFGLRYFSYQNDPMVTPVADLNNVGLVEVTLEVQSPFTSFIDLEGNRRFASAMWKQTRLASQNLKR
jgi:hypothetical protein